MGFDIVRNFWFVYNHIFTSKTVSWNWFGNLCFVVHCFITFDSITTNGNSFGKLFYWLIPTFDHTDMAVTYHLFFQTSKLWINVTSNKNIASLTKAFLSASFILFFSRKIIKYFSLETFTDYISNPISI